MATNLWGKVYFKDIYAGILQEEPGNKYVFTYDSSYLENNNPAISFSLPLRKEPFISEYGLHPFFDNLVAEGWLKNAQAKTLGIKSGDRFALLLGFGFDLAGAISIIDPRPQELKPINDLDEALQAAICTRGSLSGVQRKLLLIKDGSFYRPTKPKELSTHIAKLASGNYRQIIELEFLTSLAVTKLLPNDKVVEMEIIKIPAIHEKALVIKRFDRVGKVNPIRIHFEEFNQLLEKNSDDKYEGSYEDLGKFILDDKSHSIKAEIERLFKRIIVCFLVGNTDAHLKNFAMFHGGDGLRLTPLYDLVAAVFYKELNHRLALKISGEEIELTKLLPKHILSLAKAFDIKDNLLIAIITDLEKRLAIAKEAINKSKIGDKNLRTELIIIMEKRWNKTFASIGQLLFKRQNKGEKRLA
jgi:serine/threonine-protein kinase HipA